MTRRMGFRIITVMKDPVFAKLIDPIAEGEYFFETWKIAGADLQRIDKPTLLIRLANDDGRGLSIVLSPADPASPCYERTPSFNVAFAKEKEKEGPLGKNEEEALVYILEAVKLNDRGRFLIQTDEKGESALVETAPKATLLTKILDVLFPPKKKTDGENRSGMTEDERSAEDGGTDTKDGLTQ